ncbi:MAG: DUF748 domain-containing protein [Steroidobacteraceae bacterium]|jgi:uncharacterized protein involved in outer membrane biogenesis|nr:DUF748 domain-containing protein [Steroidobacteraceae bacterium]
MKRRLIVTALVVGVLIGGYAAFGTYAVPGLVRDGVVSGLRAEFGREASLGEVRFHPFQLRLVARDFEVRDGEGTRTLGFGLLNVDFAPAASLWRRAWTFEAIRVEQPYARLIQFEDGSTNLSRLFAGQEPAAAPSGDAALPPLRIGRFELDGGEFDFEDRARAAPFLARFAPISFGLTDFFTEGDGNAFRLSATGSRGARLDFEGVLDVRNRASRGSVGVAALPAAQLAEYLGDLLPVKLPEGFIAIELEYDVSRDEDGLAGTVAVPRIEVRDLATLAPGYDQPWRIGSILVSDSRVDLAAQTLRIGGVEVAGARLPVARTSAGLQLPGLVAAEDAQPAPPPARADAAAPPPATEQAVPESVWRVEVASLAVRDVVVPITDRTLSPAATLELNVPELRVGGIAWPLGGTLDVTAKVVSGSGGSVGLRGSVTPEPLAADLAVKIEALDLTPAQPYIATTSDLLLDAGSVAGELSLTLEPGQAAPFRVAGDLSVNGLRTRDRLLEQEFARWRSLELTGLAYSSTPASLEIREVVAREPWIKLVLGANGVTNIEAVLDPAAAARKAERIAAERAAGKAAGDDEDESSGEPIGGPPEPAAPGMAMRIGRVRIVDGATHFADFTVEPNFAVAAQQLGGTITGLSSDPAARAKVDIAGKVDRYAPVNVTGEVNYLAAESFTDLTARFDNIDLSTFNPYSGKFAGYIIDKGKLSVLTHYRVENRRLDAEHKIRIDQLELGGKVDSPDAITLPLKLAIALLKDRNGVIDLDLPVSGSVDDPSFRVGPIIWKMFVNLLGKIVTAPFALIGSLFGGGEELAFLDFAPGSAELDAANRAKLETLRTGLVERPGLRLDIPAAADPVADRMALEARRWEAALSEGAAGDAWRADRAAYRDRLVALYRGRLGAKPEIPAPPKPAEGEPAIDPTEHAVTWLEAALRPTFAVTDEDLAELARGRASAAQDLLLADGQVEPSRVFVVMGEAKPTEGAVRLELSLQ